MIQHLSISNYVLIESLEVDLDSGFNIITGETGSGKSILLGALSLAMGERADRKALLDQNKKCIVELEVRIKGLGLEELFEKYDIEHTDLCTLRRQIDPQGRSRAFVNDIPVRLEILKTISAQVVHVHSQHKNALVGSTAFQFSFLDHLAKAKEPSRVYRALFKQWSALQKHLEKLREQEKSSSVDEDYFRFQLKELEQSVLKGGEQEELEERLSALENAGEVRELVAILEEEGVASSLELIRERLANAGRSNNSLAKLHERYKSVLLEIKDVFTDLEKEVANVEMDPAEKQRLTQRSDILNGLLHKHRVNNVPQLLEVKDELEMKLSGISHLDEEIEDISGKLNKLEKELFDHARNLSSKRAKAAEKIARMVEAQLQDLGMASAKFKILLKKTEKVGPHGVDDLELAFSANKGVEVQVLGKIASGGELSRIMLSMISLLTDAKNLPAIIFDEIDTGVSGDVAARMGNRLKQMAKNMQVVCITHLPQIAGKAHTHFKVLRAEDNGRTQTILRVLNEEERVQEVAQMLSGTSVGNAAIENARALMDEA